MIVRVQREYQDFRQSLLRVGIAAGGLPDNPVGLMPGMGRSPYPPPGEPLHGGPDNGCAITNSATIDCGPLAAYSMVTNSMAAL